jgi:lysophospholipase L1-like esterase
MNNIVFLESWKKFQIGERSANLGLFARDGLHLNEAGTAELRNLIEGRAGALVNAKKKKCLPI